MKKAKRKFLKEGSSPNVVEKDYDDGGAFKEGAIKGSKGIVKEVKDTAEDLGKGFVAGSSGVVKGVKNIASRLIQGKPKIAKKGWR
jgi:hypothetical protein